jgi:hypothetical protein
MDMLCASVINRMKINLKWHREGLETYDVFNDITCHVVIGWIYSQN